MIDENKIISALASASTTAVTCNTIQPVLIIILKVYQEDNDKYIEVPVTPESTCNDVIACVQEPGDQSCSIIQKWKEHEYALRDYERPYEILQHWGDFQDEIKFYLRYGPSATSSPIFPDGEATQVEGRRSRSRNNMRDPSTTANTGLPGGVDLTLSELQDMAARQQQQIENQQQILVAKEQRLKYLKQQEQRQQHITAENERLKKLRDRVESQEMKLKKLRALRGEVEKHQNTNGNLNSELESVKALFNEKEKELALAVSKVEQLTQQLEEIKKEKSNITNGDKQNATAVELDKLRRELMLRNKLNEQQNSKLIVHRDMLNQRKDEMSKMDKRIQELQQRLKKKKAQQAELKKNQSNQKLDNKMPGRPAGTNIAAVEPYIQHVPKENTNDDVANKPGFAKFNPKYQSLPSNVRVTNPDKNSALENSDKSKNSEQNNNKENYQIPLVVKVDSSNGKAIQNGVSPSELSESLKKAAQRHQNNSLENSSSNNELSRKTPPPLPVRSGTTTLTHLAPRPFGSTYSTSVLTNRTQEQNMAHNVNIHEDVRTGGSGQSSPASSDSSQKDGNINIFPNKNNNHSTDQSQYNLPNSVSNNSNNEKHVNGANSKSNKPGQQKIHPSPQSNENSSLPSNKSHGATQNASGHSSVPLDEVDSSHPIKSPVDTGPKKVSKHPVANNNQLPSYEKAVKNRNINLSPTSGDNSKQNLNISDASTSSSNSDTSNGSKKTPTVRYASKNVIANTYMGKLGPEALAKYQSLNMLYKNFLPSSADGPVPGKHENKTDTSTDSSQSLSPPEYTSRNDQQSSQPSYLQKIPPRWQAGGVPTSPLDIQHPDIPSDKVSHNHQKTPKTLRRRHSDSDNEDISKLIHKYVDRHSPKKHDGGHYQRSNGQDTQATSFKDQIPEKVLVDDMGNLMDIPENVENSEQDNSNNNHFSDSSRIPTVQSNTPVVLRKKKTNLRRERSVSSGNRVSFDPLALLLDASLEGEVELVKKCATQVENVSESNDEGITALHNAICAGHYDIVTFLVEFGCDANSPDSDGWTPLHCAASCNNLPMVKFLVEHGACIFATTISDHETAAEKCEEDEDGFDGCSEYLYSIQEKLGILNNGVVYAVFDYQAQNSDELDFNIGDEIVVLRKGDELEKEWWWSRLRNKEGYIPRNLLGLYPRVLPQSRNNSDS